MMLPKLWQLRYQEVQLTDNVCWCWQPVNGDDCRRWCRKDVRLSYDAVFDVFSGQVFAEGGEASTKGDQKLQCCCGRLLTLRWLRC